MAATTYPSEKTSTTPPRAKVFATMRRSILLVSLSFGILNFVLPIYGKDIGASAVEIGLLFSVFSLMTVVLRPLVGIGLDRLGRRWFFIAGMAAYALTMLGFAFAQQVAGLMVARLLEGTASALLWLATNAIVADLAGTDERARSFGGVSQAANQGGMMGVFIGFTVLFSLGITAGWKPLFLGYAAVGFLAAVIAWRRMPETLVRRESIQSGASAGLRAVLRSRALSVLLLVTVITGASSAMTAPILMIFLQEKFQAGMTDLAWAFFPAGLVWTILPSHMGRLADRFGRRPLMALALVSAATVSFFIPILSSLAALSVLWVLEAVCFTASSPASQALITDLTDESQRGRVYGIFAMAGGLGAVIGPLAGGWLYETIHQSTPFFANAAALFASALILWLVLKER